MSHTTHHTISVVESLHAVASPNKFINRIKVNPYNQLQISLGTFSDDTQPKGFSVELTPDPNPDGSFTTKIMNVESATHNRLMMHLANNGSKAITATIHQL